ncbi:hypothetical protein G6F70_000436 [Rhizopus microsporus]|uniref:Uncharacterized protein n=2 Tax=Rhizopus TaxID=4842 RepID=A0A367JZJ2_RHIAZ|nr:hypothetical protein G6F71_004025 [Rhizopus microsporus]RCH95317.1 hypothetical protein CU097_010217 [Rhizopus azygosporus]KAG1204485.1 hypothetical protein G6F70_000436 [Rhizopus microsporus]KAG1215841.1 hypothetical protein G6F69_000652 [Rhizopus microsporus]KAG1234378.1 hypothetical protein G6F67_003585 [Rhizopus microsporus]
MVVFERTPRIETKYEDDNRFHRKFCGFMSLRGGCGIACAIWIGLNTYIATTAFLGFTPIFSYLDKTALIIMASISIFFGLVALFILYGLFVDRPGHLQLGFLLLVLTVPVFLADVFANIILFGVQKSSYMNWCVGQSRGHVDETITVVFVNGSQIQFDYQPTSNNDDLFNCHKLWEDEIKFALAILIVISICYVYWSACIFYYFDKLRGIMAFNGIMPTAFMNYYPRFIPNPFFRTMPPPSGNV